MEIKKIIEEKIKSIKIILFILKGIKSGNSLRESILKKNSEFENNEREWIKNRKIVNNYLKKIFLGIFANI